MGNSSSRRRRRHQQHHHRHDHHHNPGPVYPPLPPPPPGFHTEISPCPHLVSPYFYRPPQPGSYFYQHQGGGYYPQAPPLPPPPPLSHAPHHFLPLPPPPPAPWSGSTAIVPVAPAAAVPVPEYQAASTVRNEVHLNKATLRLEKDEAVPGNHVVAFSFDASTAGSITVFFLSQETPTGSVVTLSSLFPPPRRHHFKTGLGQKFKQESGLDFSLIDEQDLAEPGPNNVYPLIIRMETSPKNIPPDAVESPEPVGGALKKWIDCQQTYAVIRKIDRDRDVDRAEFEVKVVKQIIWVGGVRYELQEIFGIGGSETSGNCNDSGKECVICLSEPKDTTVLPCRHMCMCSDCADVLRHQTNLCPICRCPVESLIHMVKSE